MTTQDHMEQVVYEVEEAIREWLGEAALGDALRHLEQAEDHLRMARRNVLALIGD